MQQPRQSSEKSNAKNKRVSLSKRRPEIEQWVSQGRSDEWIADALGTSRQSVQSFRSRHGILRRGRNPGTQDVPSTAGDEPAIDEPTSVFEGVLDQGEEGYGLWLDPAVAEDPTFKESFAGVADIRVLIQRGRIILEPATDPDVNEGDAASEGPKDGSASGNGRHGEMAEAATVEPGPSNFANTTSGEPGQVKFFDESKGFGFLIRPDGEEIFFHRSEIEGGAELEAGDYVTYEPGASQRGPVAKRVRAAG